MYTEELIEHLDRLGKQLTDAESEKLNSAKRKAQHENPWFTPENIERSLLTWGALLKAEVIKAWLERESFRMKAIGGSKLVGLIPAGNIPLVGLHDMICILLSGHRVAIKPSADDQALMSFVIQALKDFDSRFNERILVQERLNGVEAMIATGSNNSARYFEAYFGHLPHIIRRNRNSVGIINGQETDEELEALAFDVFSYFGLGCRNITQFLLPAGYDVIQLFKGLDRFQELNMSSRYMNNYTYHKALFLMNQTPHYDNGFVLLKQSDQVYAPVGCLHYHFYESESVLTAYLAQKSGEIQVICSNSPINGFEVVTPGTAQAPRWWDYADGVNTLAFLVRV